MKFIIKTYDFFDYMYNRTLMKSNYYINLIKKNIILNKNIKSILIVRLASLGDIVRSTAIIELLRKKYPKTRIDYLTAEIGPHILKNNPNLNNIYTLKDLNQIKKYDWIINLQAPPPPKNFLKDKSFKDIIKQISNINHRLITGRQIKNNKEILPTNIFYCNTEIEELFLTSLLKYNSKYITKTKIHLENNKNTLKKFKLSENNYLGIFLGSNSEGGDDNGFRTYSIDYLEKLIKRFKDNFKIVIIGQSSLKTKEEIKQYKKILKKHPKTIDLVDKTSLQELFQIINKLKLLISCDSGPLHIAMALKTQVIGLFVNSSEFKLSPKKRGKNYIAINAFRPCSKYSYRWKFHCTACKNKHSKMYNCKIKKIPYQVDSIPIEKIEKAVNSLVLQ